MAAVLAAARALPGQSIRGTVTDQATGRAVAGALVTLIDTNDSVLATAATSGAGRYALNGFRPGDFRLKVLRIGFHPWVSPAIHLDSAQALLEDLAVTADPVELAEITVEASGRCQARTEGSALVATLWDEAEKNLGLADRSLRSRERIFASELKLRTLDEFGRTLEERGTSSTGRGEWPVVGLDADSLASGGYVQPSTTGDGPVYYGPDARTFFSPAFLRTHCLRPVPAPEDDPGLIGLGFEPLPDRRIPDIRGVLWLDRKTAELQALEYSYTGLWAWVPEGSARGRVDFLRLEDGSWIITGWELRAPIASVPANRRGTGTSRESMEELFGSSRVRLGGFREVEGMVSVVLDREERILWRRRGARRRAPVRHCSWSA